MLHLLLRQSIPLPGLLRNLLKPAEVKAPELKEYQVKRRVFREVGYRRIGRILAELGDALVGLRLELGLGGVRPEGGLCH